MTAAETARPLMRDEEARLSALRRYDILDTPPDGAFDRVTALAAHVFGVPIALISLVDRDRIWFKSRHGLDASEIPRSPGLCASAILGTEPWIVTDATLDPRTLANPLVAGEFGLRFYTAIPLTTRDGYSLGTLCVIDTQPRAIAEHEIVALEHLAAIVMDEMELRLSARRAQRQLEEAKSDLVATLSHELRTPLSAVYGAAKTLLDERVAADDDTRGQLLDMLASETQRLAAIVNDIVAASQLESGAVEVVSEHVDPVRLASRAVEAAGLLLPANLQLRLEPAEGVPPAIEADPGRTRQVLDNLIENAIRYSPRGGVITVEVAPAADGVRFAVHDEGIGIPPPERDRIFEKFYRLDPAQHGGVGGAGLGLYISRLLARELGGRVDLEPRGSRGSTFVFWLPRAGR
ncbi:MAG: HAMP domain-containing histidine kinase [Actinomycetota bacterium]|nr:HAMP domain-containing histidine kinase [Actinomycetota bacterium]